MRTESLHILRCPACYGILNVDTQAERLGALIDGKLVCAECGVEYPVIEGVAFLAILDSNWAIILKELIARRELTFRQILEAPVEEDRRRNEEAQLGVFNNLMVDLFNQAAQRIDFSKKPLLIDVGAGPCMTASYFAENGARVFATDTEIANLKYINFGYDDDPVHEFEINGHPFARKEKKVMKAPFSAVVCDGQRLPFADGAFDISLCRSVLHHIEKPHGAVSEMMRVVREDGQVIVVSEPIRSVLDNEEDHRVEDFAKEEGLNERVPTLLHYVGPMMSRHKKLEVQYWPNPPVGRTRSLLRMLPYDFTRHFHHGQIVEGWRLIKLLFAGASVNIFAKRNSAPISKPPVIKPSEIQTHISEVANLYFDYENEETLEGFQRNTLRLKQLRLRILNAKHSALASHVLPAQAKMEHLESGWRDAVRMGSETFRYTMNHAGVLIGSASAQTLTLRITLGNLGLGDSSQGTILFDGEQVGDFLCEGNAWSMVEIPVENPSKHHIHLVEIENTRLARSLNKDDEKTYGVAVKLVSLD